jgi:uncharacterized membrane protein (DUF2068 family)
VVLPLRGRLLRDRYVLRLIALDRLLHFLVLSALSVVLVLFAHNRVMLNADVTRILKDLQGGLGGPVNNSSHGIVHDLRRLFAVRITSLYLVAAATAAYAALEGAEAVGLWRTRRWAEYLTFVAAAVLVPADHPASRTARQRGCCPQCCRAQMELPPPHLDVGLLARTDHRPHRPRSLSSRTRPTAWCERPGEPIEAHALQPVNKAVEWGGADRIIPITILVRGERLTIGWLSAG